MFSITSFSRCVPGRPRRCKAEGFSLWLRGAADVDVITHCKSASKKDSDNKQRKELSPSKRACLVVFQAPASLGTEPHELRLSSPPTAAFWLCHVESAR